MAPFKALSAWRQVLADYGATDGAVIAAAALFAAGASLYAAPGLHGVFGAGLALLMLAIAVIDQRRFIIPNELSAAAAAVGVAYAAVVGPQAPAQAVIAALIRGGVLLLLFLLLREAYMRLRRREGMGLGDVKLAGVGGIWLSWPAVAVTIEIAAGGALVALLIGHALGRRRIHAATRLPFGLFLAPAIWLGWLFQVWLDAL